MDERVNPSWPGPSDTASHLRSILATVPDAMIIIGASEVRDPAQRQRAIDLVLQRHPGLAKLGRPDLHQSAVMRAYCSIVTILDYSKGFGHADVLTASPGGVEMTPARDDDWGFGSELKPIV